MITAKKIYDKIDNLYIREGLNSKGEIFIGGIVSSFIEINSYATFL